MAPGRKKGSSKEKEKDKLRLGDLVLAKVKGFPMWPAKVSRPEDWKHESDPKKCFVYFYGTKEIAFVSPSDIQVFTNESKSKISERSNSKFKHFTQAVKEICEEYDRLVKGKSRTLLNHSDPTASGTDKDDIDAEGGLKNANEANGQQWSDGSSDHSESADCDSSKGSSLGNTDNLSPAESADTKNPLSNNLDICEPKIESSSDDIPPDRINILPKSDNKEGLKSRNRTGMVFVRTKKKSVVSGARNLDAGSMAYNISFLPKDETVEEKICKEDSLETDTSNHGDASGNVLSDAVRKDAKSIEKRTSGTSRAGSDVLNSDAAGKSRIKSKIDLGSQDVKSNVSKVKKSSELGNATSKVKSDVSTRACDTKTESSENEDILAFKRRKRPLHVVNDFSKNSLDNPGETISRAPGSHVSKRRAVCLVNEEEEDAEPRTPVHGKSANNMGTHSLNKKSDANSSSARRSHGSGIVSSKTSSVGMEKRNSIDVKTLSSKKSGAKKSDAQSVCNFKRLHGSNSVIDFKEKAATHVNQVTIKRSSVQTPESLAKPLKNVDTDTTQSPEKLPGDTSKMDSDSPKQSPNSLSTSKQIPEQLKAVQTPTKSQLENTPKAIHNLNETTALIDSLSPVEPDLDGRISSLHGSRTPELAISMKDLIAAAQAKRKQAHSQHMTLASSNSFFHPSMDVPEKTPSPLPVVQAHCSAVSPFNDSHTHQVEDDSEQKVDQGQQRGSGSLSGGTEAAVARDAFEGMIETLSRTKESIGRATRLAIDCAKYGIANEVVQLLIRKLESEPSLHRKVDLFFLVDSITQCSHNQKGIAGASYVPTVESALQRLLSAAAPPGSSARENRRQCLKVLKLWLERKIFPDSLLRRFMEDIKGSNDDTSACFSLKRPSRAERSVDDPIREMEGIHVDEYGSNATFQLPGLLSSNVFDEEDEEEDLQTTHKEVEKSDTEMEDAVHGEHENVSISVKSEPELNDADNSDKPAENNDVHLSPLSDESPPPPPDSPPPTPPLPTSPPPAPPPQLPPSAMLQPFLQSEPFPPSSRQLEYAHSLQDPNFQPSTTSYTQIPIHPPLPPSGSSHFSYSQRPFPTPFHVSPHQEKCRPFPNDKRWRLPCNEYSTDPQNSMWMNGRGPPGVSYGQEGYFRPPGNNMNSSGPPIPGHGNSPMLQCRPDISTVNCWRPT